MNSEDRALIVAIGQAARTCAMYRELLEVARRYQASDEIDRLTAALQQADEHLARLIAQALEDQPAANRQPEDQGEGDTTADDQ